LGGGGGGGGGHSEAGLLIGRADLFQRKSWLEERKTSGGKAAVRRRLPHVLQKTEASAAGNRNSRRGGFQIYFWGFKGYSSHDLGESEDEKKKKNIKEGTDKNKTTNKK